MPSHREEGEKGLNTTNPAFRRRDSLKNIAKLGVRRNVSSYFLVKTAFTGADFPNLLEQLIDIMLAEVITMLQALIIDGKTLHDMVAKNPGCPNA